LESRPHQMTLVTTGRLLDIAFSKDSIRFS
jgi:hypothetical protein